MRGEIWTVGRTHGFFRFRFEAEKKILGVAKINVRRARIKKTAKKSPEKYWANILSRFFPTHCIPVLDPPGTRGCIHIMIRSAD